MPIDRISMKKVIKGRCCSAEAPSAGSSRQAGTGMSWEHLGSLGQGITQAPGLFSHLPSNVCPCSTKHTSVTETNFHPASWKSIPRARMGLQGWVRDAFPCIFGGSCPAIAPSIKAALACKLLLYLHPPPSCCTEGNLIHNGLLSTLGAGGAGHLRFRSWGVMALGVTGPAISRIALCI